jgi:hypothetical protein
MVLVVGFDILLAVTYCLSGKLYLILISLYISGPIDPCWSIWMTYQHSESYVPVSSKSSDLVFFGVVIDIINSHGNYDVSNFLVNR